jgi:hypothetical protein
VPTGGEAQRLRELVSDVLGNQGITRRAAEVAAEVAALPVLDVALLDPHRSE